MDPIPLADDLCELLRAPSLALDQLQAQVRGAGAVLGGAIAEIDRRGFLPRLLPEVASEAAALLWDTILASAGQPDLLRILGVLIRRRGEYAAHYAERALLRAEEMGGLAALFQSIIAAGSYGALVGLLDPGALAQRPGLLALARARPMYERDVLNQAAAQAARAGGHGAAHDVLIVPGYTPVDAQRPMPLAECAPARDRLDAAIADLRAGQAPFILVSGGSVYPAGTPHNEGLMMRAYLLARGVPAQQVLVDPHARHSTTNLRNAGRLMRALGMGRGLIVTGFDREIFSQQFYFAHADLSTFADRCQRQLGYRVGELRGVDDHHVSFTPAAEVDAPNYRDPWDV